MKSVREGRCSNCGAVFWRESYSHPAIEDFSIVVLLPPEFSSGHVCLKAETPKAETPKPTTGSK